MIAVKGADKRAARDPGKLYAKALEHHKQMEAELSRAQNRWQKSRLALHRLEKRLDKLDAARMTDQSRNSPSVEALAALLDDTL